MALQFTDEDRQAIAGIVGRYPHEPAALLPVLHYAQDKFGHLSPEVQLLVAHAIDVPPPRVREVVTFYEMYHEHPEGQFHLELCTNIACHLVGGDALLEHLKKRLGIEVGHTTEDGVFSLMEAECLASCGSGPTLKVGVDYYEFLTEEAVDALIERFEKEAPSLNGRHYRCAKDGPHVGPVPGFEPKLPVIQPPTKAEAAPAPAAEETSADEPAPEPKAPEEKAEGEATPSESKDLPSFEAPSGPKK